MSNLLSFGPDGLDLEMRNLNVLIGPNGSGKSNFLEIFELLRTMPSNDSLSTIRSGGGAPEWIWKGAPKDAKIIIDLVINYSSKIPIRHFLSWHYPYLSFQLSDEKVENERSIGEKPDVMFFYRYFNGRPMISVNDLKRSEKKLSRDSVNPDLSILSQRRDPDNYPEISFLAKKYESIRVYKDWTYGRRSNLRLPLPIDLRNDHLDPDFSNIGLVLSRLRKDPTTKRDLINALRDIYEGITDFEVLAEGGYLRIFFTEGDFFIPSTRISDGTLRYLCLLAILLDPTPPPLICIEEPELGLHPYIIPKLADHLVDASSRTQLIVTTHSDILIDALGNKGHAESVLVCEKHDGQTQIRRLKEEDLAHWLKAYGLGQLWMRGEIGGTRW
ncbi:MAG: AAA family ATPase [Saprospiraceae bacterium]|nr:AAA family ATPase [Saprospiraceae bacterium]